METKSELNSIKGSDVKTNIQAGLIYDRIVGPANQDGLRFHPHAVVAVWNVGSHIADSGKFRGSYRILEYAFAMHVENRELLNQANAELAHHFARIFKSGLQKDETRSPKQVKFEQILHIQSIVLSMLKKGKALLDDKEKMENYKDSYREQILQTHYYMVTTMLQFISLTCAMLHEATPSQEEDFRKLVKDTIDLKLKGVFGQTLIELASNETTSLLQLKDGEKFPIVEYPCAITIGLLESLGAE